MKASYYNLIVNLLSRKKYILFNTLSGGILLINERIKKIFEKNNFEKLTQKEKTELVNGGFLIDNSINELKLVKALYRFQQCDDSQLEIMINITRLCNLACPYCFEGGSRNRILTKKDLDIILKFIKNRIEFHRSKELIVQIFGGEPLIAINLLNKLLLKITNLASQFKLPVNFIVYSNGTLFNEKIIKILSPYNFLYTQITIDGAKKDHDRRRFFKNGRGSYDLIIENLKKIRNTSLNPVIRINVDTNNYKNIVDLLDDLINQGFKKIPIGFGFIRPMTKLCKSYPYGVSKEKVIQILPSLWKTAVKRRLNIDLSINPTFIYCNAHRFSSYVIDVDRRLYKCAGLQGLKEHCIGKINNKGEIDGLSNIFYEWMAKDPTEMMPCKNCKILPICGGGCTGSTYSIYGSYYKNNCFIHHSLLIREKLILYAKQQEFLKGK